MILGIVPNTSDAEEQMKYYKKLESLISQQKFCDAREYSGERNHLKEEESGLTFELLQK